MKTWWIISLLGVCAPLWQHCIQASTRQTSVTNAWAIQLESLANIIEFILTAHYILLIQMNRPYFGITTNILHYACNVKFIWLDIFRKLKKKLWTSNTKNLPFKFLNKIEVNSYPTILTDFQKYSSKHSSTFWQYLAIGVTLAIQAIWTDWCDIPQISNLIPAVIRA